MIKNEPGKIITNTVKQIEESKFDFFLTGSRFFGGVKEQSDVDFFVEDSEEVRVFLKEIGFVPVVEYKNYSHNIVKGLFVLNANWPPVHVQLVLRAEAKNTLQNKLRDIGFPWGLPKDYQKVIWEQASNQI